MKIACISDSPKIHSGFGNVARMIYEGFHKEFEIEVFGQLDFKFDAIGELPYPFTPVSALSWRDMNDQVGFADAINFVGRVKPDIVFIMVDPGNLLKYMQRLLPLNEYLKGEGGKGFRVFAYIPIEGLPVPKKHLEAIETVLQNDGKVVTWCKSASEGCKPYFNLPYVYFGLDHANFREYSKEDKNLLRDKAHLNNITLIGSVGVNKRTKGFETLIYVAKTIKELGVKDVKFYAHTDPLRPMMQGFLLKDLAETYGVEEMFIWKQQTENMYLGDDRDKGTIELVREIEKPDTYEEGINLFMEYDYISKLNCLDMYVDLSKVEGWGLPVMEAINCGIPTMYVYDTFVRSEIISNKARKIPTIDESVWETWHTGVKLATVQPRYVAGMILDNRTPKPERINLKWEDAQEKLNQEMREFINVS